MIGQISILNKLYRVKLGLKLVQTRCSRVRIRVINKYLKVIEIKYMSPLIRANSTGVLISGNVKNRKELDALMDEYADAYGGRSSFMKMFCKGHTMSSN